MQNRSSIVDATISDLSIALSSGRLTSVDLVAKYFLRISAYDCRATALNSIPLINENVFEEAAATDDRRASGHVSGILDGIPFTVKDSYKVQGMTVASGSEAFENLIANEDAFTVSALREAGAVLIGRTNMCPMAYGGMLRGVYGRAESPYNKDYLAAAFGSGSSNGSGVSVASSFAAFGMGEETVSSGRSPASNNALVAYTPSRGLISIRGNWPLYPTCDVVVPHTRTTSDLFILLHVLFKQDSKTIGDFWRDQPFFQLPQPGWTTSENLSAAKGIGFLKGKRIAVPQIFLKQTSNGPYISEAIEPLWNQAKVDLEAAGAHVELVQDLPVFSIYEKLLRTSDAVLGSSIPENWNTTERSVLIAHAWEDFLENNHDASVKSLRQVDPTKIFPHFSSDNVQIKYTEPANAVPWAKLADYASNRPPSSTQHIPDKREKAIYSIPNLCEAIKALENIRIKFFEEWLATHNYDFAVFPAAGEVARADADVSDSSARHAWTDGIKYSHGNRALRHLGIPSVTVPMGVLDDSKMPMGLTFLSRAYDDFNLLQAGHAYELASQRRIPPPLTPPLASDEIPVDSQVSSESRPKLTVTKCIKTPAENGDILVSIEGTLDLVSTQPSHADFKPTLEVYIDGKSVPTSSIIIISDETPAQKTVYQKFKIEQLTTPPPAQDSRNQVVGKIARDSTMVMILGRDGERGRPSGYVKLLH
ncbi:hypothetical protein LTR84_005303 [Exophiala bonariae]|uniref:Amidase domain-containing protein n=1 Tax=Exophiala bonariae TaxID=1690606 RepID=A0AAV9N4M3_9EURO|nr:hypothetical protein LTR84_005303 [Exophiala bonariae]